MLKERVELMRAQGLLARGRLYSDKVFAGASGFLVTSLLMGPVCLISQGRFEEPVCPWSPVVAIVYKRPVESNSHI